MANTGKLKPKSGSRFGELTPNAESVNVLDAPEHAPAEPKRKRTPKDAPIRKTSWGSTVQADFPQRVKIAAAKRGCSVVELLESWLEAEEKKSE